MTRIDTPYDPDSVDGEFGWLWMGTDADDREWQLVFTEHGADGEPVLRVIADDADGAGDSCHDAAAYAGRPYLPLSPPAAEPGAALLVTMRLAEGGSLAACWMQDDASAQAASDAIRAAMIRTPDAGIEWGAREALALCRDSLATHLRYFLVGECVCHHDGTPQLQTLTPEARAEITPDVRVMTADTLRSAARRAGRRRAERQARADAIQAAALARWIEAELTTPGSDAYEIAGRLAAAGLLEATEGGGRIRVTLHGRTALADTLRAALRLWAREVAR